MKLWPLLLVALSIALGAGWLRANNTRIREGALAAAQRDSLTRAVEEADAHGIRVQAAYNAARIAEAARIVEAEQEARRAATAARVASGRLNATLDSLRNLPDLAEPVRIALDSLAAQLATERREHAAQVGALEIQVGSLTSQLALADSSIAVLGRQLTARDALIGSLEAALEDANPGLFTRLWRSLPSYSAVAGIGIVLGGLVL